MAIETRSVAIYKCGSLVVGTRPKQLADALQDFARSRATRDLIRQGKDREVRCDLSVPFVRNCRARPDQLGRAPRAVWRCGIDVAKSGDYLVVDLRIKEGADHVIEVQGYVVSRAAGSAGE